MITLHCRCRREIQVPLSLEGKVTTCPACGISVLVPSLNGRVENPVEVQGLSVVLEGNEDLTIQPHRQPQSLPVDDRPTQICLELEGGEDATIRPHDADD